MILSYVKVSLNPLAALLDVLNTNTPGLTSTTGYALSWQYSHGIHNLNI